MVATTTVTIAARFNGPPDSGNGGYGCGVVAPLVDGPAVVELRAPPPLDAPMEVVMADTGVNVRHHDQVVIRARPAAPVALTPPTTVGVDEAVEATRRYPGFDVHPFPTCFVCGPDRPPGDGLRIFPGPLTTAEVVAAAWTPDPGLADGDGVVAPAFVWAALDCPSGFAVIEDRVAVLARMQVHQHHPVPVGQELVVLGWPQERDGRKLSAASAIQDAAGRVLAVADTLWIELADG